jgi:hypothetical protein
VNDHGAGLLLAPQVLVVPERIGMDDQACLISFRIFR